MVASVRAIAATTKVSPANTAYVLNKPTGTVVGDIMVAMVTLNAASGQNLTAPAGWTRLYASPTDGGQAGIDNTLTYQSIYVYWRAVDGTEGTTFTFTAAVSATGSGNIITIQGADTTSPFSIGTVFLENPGPSSYTTNTTNLTTTETSLLISFYGHDSGSLAVIPPSNMTVAWNDATGQKSAGAYLDNVAAGTTTITWSTATSTKNASWSAGVKSAGAPSTPISASASNALGVTESSAISIVATKSATDGGALGVTDTASVDTGNVTKSASDTRSISISTEETLTNATVPNGVQYIGKSYPQSNSGDIFSAIPIGTEGGDLLIMALACSNANTTYGTPAGWTLSGNYSDFAGVARLRVYTKLAAGTKGSPTTESIPTITYTGGFVVSAWAQTFTFRNTKQTSPYFKLTQNQSNSSQSTTHAIVHSASDTDPQYTHFYLIQSVMNNTPMVGFYNKSDYVPVTNIADWSNNNVLAGAYTPRATYLQPNFNITSEWPGYGVYMSFMILPSGITDLVGSQTNSLAVSETSSVTIITAKSASDTAAVSVSDVASVNTNPTLPPTFVGSAGLAGGAGNLISTIPSGIQSGDLIIVLVIGTSPTTTYSMPAGWTPITPVVDSANTNKLWGWYGTSTGVQGNNTVTSSDTTNSGMIITCAFRGVPSSGTQMIISSGTTNASSSTTHQVTNSITNQYPVFTNVIVTAGEFTPIGQISYFALPNGHTEVMNNALSGTPSGSMMVAYKRYLAYEQPNVTITSSYASTGEYFSLALLPPGTYLSASQSHSLAVSETSSVTVLSTAKTGTETPSISVADTSSVLVVTTKSATDAAAVSTSEVSTKANVTFNPPSYVTKGVSVNGTVATSGTLSVPIPSGTQGGDLMVVAIATDSGIDTYFAAPSGWSPSSAANNASESAGLKTFVRIAGGTTGVATTDTSPVVFTNTGGSVFCLANMFVFRGVNPSSPHVSYGDRTSDIGASSTTHTLVGPIGANATVATTFYVISGDMSANTTPTWSTPFAFTEVEDVLAGASRTSMGAGYQQTQTYTGADITVTSVNSTEGNYAYMVLLPLAVTSVTASDGGALGVTDAGTKTSSGGKSLPAAVDTDEPGTYIEPESLGHNPPWIDANGNLYKVLEHEDASQPWTIMLKSADGGETWHIQNGAVRPTSQVDLEGTWTEQRGNKIYFLQTQDSNDPPTMTYFRTSDHPTNPDTWSGVYWSLTPFDTTNSQSAQYQWVAFNFLSTGEWWAFYHDNKYVKVGAGDTGTPGTYQNLVMTFPMPCTGQNDVTHIVYTDLTLNQVLYRTLTATGTMSAATRVDATGRFNPASNTYACHSNVVSVMNGATENICVLYAEANQTLWLATIVGGTVTRTQISTGLVSSRSSVPSGITTSGNIDCHIAKDPDDGTLYLVWMDQSDGKLYYRTRTSTGTLGAITLLYDPPGVANTSSNSTGVADSEAWYPFPNVIKYPNGTKVLAYTADLGWHLNSTAHVKYNELALASGPTAIVGSQSNSLAVSETSSISTSGAPVGTETTAVSVSEVSAILKTMVASESNSVAVADTSALATLVTKSATDAAAVSVADVGGSGNIIGVNALGSTDAAAITITEGTVARTISVSGAESTAVSVAETSGISGSGSIAKTSTDGGAVSVADSSAVGLITGKTATESGAVTVTDSSSIATIANTVTGNYARYLGYAVNDHPDGLWGLDNANGFFDFSGYGRTASMASGTAGTSVAVASGFANSAVYQNTGIARFPTQAFRQGNEALSFTLEAWVFPIVVSTTAPQAILSHTGQYDGLTINGTVVSFTTKYLTASAATVSYDLQTLRAAHVVGVHTNDKNMLYVNGELVAEIQLTAQQIADKYIATDGYLYCGQSTSNRKLAVNAIATYTYPLEASRINVHFAQGRNTVREIAVPTIYGGTLITTHAGDGANVYSYTYSKRQEWKRGYTTDTAFKGNDLIPMNDATDTSLPGTWLGVYELDSIPEAQLNSVSLMWNGVGATISASLDGSTWETAVNGQNLALVTPGFVPTDKLLHLRVSFAGGAVNDTSFLKSLTVTAQASAAQNNIGNRTVTVGQPAYRRIDAEPLEYRLDWGLELGTGGTLTIGPDTSGTPVNPRTIELWIYRNTATNPTINQTGTIYRQGAAGNLTFTQGEWTLVHIVTASAVTGNIVITGPAIIGHVAVYGAALSQSQSLEIYQAYTGIPKTVTVDSSAIGVSEPSDAANVYTFDWSITAAG